MTETEIDYDDADFVRKDIIISHFAIANAPIKSKIKLQKEIFLLTRSFPKFKEVLQFVPYKFGPYCQEVEAVVENNPQLIVRNQNGFVLTEKGRKYGDSCISDMVPEKRDIFSLVSRMVHEMCSQLTDDELMFFVYNTYGFTQNSDKVQSLMERKEFFARSLYEKDIISHARYQELVA